MRVLYVGGLGENESSLYRRDAIERLGHEVINFDTLPYQNRGGWLARGVRTRTLMGWAIHQLNRDLLTLARRTRPAMAWFDKPIFVYPQTVRLLCAAGIFTLQYCTDNPFGPRDDPGWRLLRRALPEYDLHLVQREVNLPEFTAAGARDVQLFRTAYEPTAHFPPPAPWTDADRVFDVVFIGSPYDNRANFLSRLAVDHGIPLRIWGAPKGWVLKDPSLYQGHPVYGDAYRETIWRSKVCLSFVTHSNCDDVAHRSFEIGACGGFLLAEDTPGHRDHFTAGEEAVFFRSLEDCADLARRYLDDEAERARIAANGRRRAVASGYGNDARIARVFAYLRQKYGLTDGAAKTRASRPAGEA